MSGIRCELCNLFECTCWCEGCGLPPSECFCKGIEALKKESHVLSISKEHFECIQNDIYKKDKRIKLLEKETNILAIIIVILFSIIITTQIILILN